MGEMEVSAVLKPRKMVARKGTKQLGSAASTEKDEMAVNTLGDALPPMTIFPRSYSETISFMMDLQVALELGTNQGGKRKRHLSLL
jgi:hypothetical protein